MIHRGTEKCNGSILVTVARATGMNKEWDDKGRGIES